MRYVPGFFLLALLASGYAQFFHVREASADSSAHLAPPTPAAAVVETHSGPAATATGFSEAAQDPTAMATATSR